MTPPDSARRTESQVFRWLINDFEFLNAVSDRSASGSSEP